MSPNIKEVISALPPEVRARLGRMAQLENKTIEELALSLLTEGANTFRFGIFAALATAAVFV